MSRRARFWIAVAAAAALPPLLGRAAPGLLDPVLALQLATGVCVAAAAVSLNLLMGYAGQISLGHGAFLALGAFASGQITARGPELGLGAGVLLAALVGGVFAFAIGLPALRLRGLYLAVATIGFAVMLEASVFKWNLLTGGSGGIELHRRFGFLSLRSNADYLAFVLVLLLLIAAIDSNVVRTKLGRAFQALRWDESVAQSYGVDVTRYKLIAFVLSGSLAAIAGTMYGHLIGLVSASSFTFENTSLLLVIIVVVGGLASRTGVIVAGLLFAILPQILGFLRGWDLIIGPLLLIDVMTRHPGGFAQAVRHAKERAAAKRARAGDAEETTAVPKLPALPRPSGLPERPALADGAPMLEVSGVSVRFGGLQALEDVSLTVPKGKIVGLIGPNGAGKTTLFNTVSGFVRPDRGTVRFMDTMLDEVAPHARSRLGMGRTFQLIGLVKDRSVLENFLLAQHAVAGYDIASALAYLPRARGVESELLERAHVAIAALGFERFTHTQVRTLSHGQQRLVELGCALVTAPELLLLDEPSAGMAPAAVESLAERLREIRDELGRTVLLIEHNIPLVLDVCDELYVLNVGRVLAHGTTEEIARHPEVVSAYFGEVVPA